MVVVSLVGLAVTIPPQREQMVGGDEVEVEVEGEGEMEMKLMGL